MRHLLHDLRFGVRVLLGSPGFSLIAIATLGLGLACTTTVFSWMQSVLYHPFSGASRTSELAVLEMVTPSAPNGGTSISWTDFRDFQRQMSGISGVAVHRQSSFTLGSDAQASQLVWGELVSGNYFSVLGVTAQVGRLYTAEEDSDALGAHPVAVISHRLWKEVFQANPAIVGTSVPVNRQPVTIIGVAPPDFRGSSPVLRFDMWIPATMGPAMGLMDRGAFANRGQRGAFSAICRLRPGVTVDQAAAEARTLAARLESAYPKSNQGVGATVLAPSDEHNGINETLHKPLLILFGVSLVVLLIVCANVANLLLARSVGRQREFGIRAALGAGRIRVAAQILMETLVLAVVGTVLGILILFWMQGSLVALAPNVGYPLHQTSLSFNWRILGFAALACGIVTMLAGASPALFVLHANLNEVLKEGSRNTGAGASTRARNLLASAEVALATVALIGAGLFVRSFQNARHFDPGFQAERVLLGRFFIESTGYSPEEIRKFSARLNERLLGSTAQTRIESAAYTDFVPLSQTAGPYNMVEVDGYVPGTGESMAVNRARVSPGYFDTLRIPLLAGRDFTARDDAASEQPVAIVNRAFEQRYFQGARAAGRKIRAMGKWLTVVGVVQNSKQFSPAEETRPFLYLPFQQFYGGSEQIYILARTREQNPARIAGAVRTIVAETDPNTAGVHLVPLAAYTEVATLGQKIAATLTAVLGLVCLILAGTGLYSVMSYTVSQRIPEIGIRMAMGAGRWDVLKMVVRQGMGIAGSGMVAGALVTVLAAHTISSMLFGVSPLDPVSFGAAAAFLAVVALLSTGLPAWRAIHTDPVSAMRR